MSDVVQKTVVYRKFNRCDGNWPDDSLQQLVVKCLLREGSSGRKVKDDWKSRQFNLPGSETHFQFINNLKNKSGFLFGVVGLYSPEEFQAIIRREIGGDEESIEHAFDQMEIFERPPLDGENYLKGHGYFLIKDDHFLMIQHMSVRTSSMEIYIQNLFEKYGNIPRGCKFELQAKLNLEDINGDVGEFRAVEIGGVSTGDWRPSETESRPASSIPSIVREQQLGEERARGSLGKRILDQLFGTMEADRILNSVPDGADLSVNVKFGFKSRSRGLDRVALSQIASAARDLPEGQIRGIGRDGTVRGNDLRLQTVMPFSRMRPNGALLELEDTFQKMMRVYYRFEEDGKLAG